jgi:chromosome condensin MukBEF ATPase and DNA-binding subunit MukB
MDAELEIWQLKSALLQTQQALMHYQAKEVQDNLARIQRERAESSAPKHDLDAPISSAHA